MSKWRNKWEIFVSLFRNWNKDNPNKIFHDHIEAHFEKEHPDWKVVCKICGKTYEEIMKEKKVKK